MPDDEEGTTEFRARGLKDLLESQEAPAKPAGGDNSRRLAMIGAGVGAVLVVVLAVVVLGGGGGDNGGDNNGGGSGVPVGLEMRPSAAVGIQPGASISICDSEAGPVAEGVVAREIKPAKSAAGQDIVQLTVLAEGNEINALGPTKAKSTWRAISSPTCPPVETTASTTTTTLPVVQPPASTPPDSAPTPPPS
jgi:hypothetical protein